MTLEYGPGLNVTIRPFHDVVTFEGSEVWATGKYRGHLAPGQICYGNRLVETFADGETLRATYMGGAEVHVVTPQWRRDACYHDEMSHHGEYMGQARGCKNRRWPTYHVAHLKRHTLIPMGWQAPPLRPRRPPNDMLVFVGRESPRALVLDRIDTGEPDLMVELVLDDPPYSAYGRIPKWAVKRFETLAASGTLSFIRAPIDRFLQPRLDLEVFPETRAVLVCESLAPVADTEGGDYGFHAGALYPTAQPGDVGVLYDTDPSVDDTHGGPSNLRFDYEVLGPPDGDWIPVRMARLRKDRPFDEWQRWYAAELDFHHELPLRVPVARLRQCRFWEATNTDAGPAVYVERPTLPDGTPVGRHAAPVPRACQNVGVHPDVGEPFLSAPALPLPAP